MYFFINVSQGEDQMTDNFPSKQTFFLYFKSNNKIIVSMIPCLEDLWANLSCLNVLCDHKTFQQTEREVAFKENNRSKKCILCKMINGASKLVKDVKVDYLVILLFCLSHIILKSQKDAITNTENWRQS